MPGSLELPEPPGSDPCVPELPELEVPPDPELAPEPEPPVDAGTAHWAVYLICPDI